MNWNKIEGRLGNKMFQLSVLVDLATQTKTDIWFQDERWFKRVAPQIREMFSEGVVKCGIDKVSIHVRRTDYVGNDFYFDLSKSDYYQRAIDMFPNEKFLVFSDDINFCKEYFKGDNFEFSEGKTDTEDMNLMASCKHNIIANSSYSWWGAWLNPNPDKIVICPKNTTKRHVMTFPKEWREI